jgi:MFS family permease
VFAGQALSATGDRVVVVALALYITLRRGSPSDLGIVLAAQSLPLVGLLLIGGVWADRLPRHRIMIATDVARALLHGTLALLILLGRAQIWQIAVIEALFGAAQAFFQPAYTGLLPQTVPEGAIQDARALTETTANLAFLVGPAIATLLVLGVGAWEAFALDAASFVVSALLLARVRPRARGAVPEPTAARRSLLRDLRDGFGEVRSRRWVWVTVAVFAGAVMCVYAQWYALAPRIARYGYGSAGVFGLLESLSGVGAVFGAILAVRWRPRRPLLAGFLMMIVWPVNDLLFSLLAPLVLIAVTAFGLGVAWALFGIWWETALASHIPPGSLSRVSAWDWMGSLAFLPLGYLVSGPLQSAFGAQAVLGMGSVIGIALVVLGLLPRQTRELGYAGEPAALPPRSSVARSA